MKDTNMYDKIPLIILVAAIQIGTARSEFTPSAQELVQVVEALQAPLRDFSCEYEGHMLYPGRKEQESLGLDQRGLRYQFTGVFRHKPIDYYLVDIYHMTYPDGDLWRETVVSNGVETEIYSRSDESRGGVLKRHATSHDFDKLGSYGRIFLIRHFLNLLKYDKKRLVHEGRELVGDRLCDHYAFVLGKEPYLIDDPDALIIRFWVDFERNGQILKMERYSGKTLRSRTTDIALEKIDIAGESYWIPIRGKHEGMADGSIYAIQEYSILKESLKINQGLREADFSIKYSIGTPITDQLKQVVYEYGQDRRPPPETVMEAQQRLEEALQAAEAARNEFLVSPPPRRGEINWLFWGPFSVSMCALFALIVVWWRRIA